MPAAERVGLDVSVVRDYARAVVSGEILAGPHVRRACARHLNDLKTCRARGLYFDEKEAQKALTFFAWLNLEDDTPFKLEPFQGFITGAIFGWMRDDGHRRFRRAYIEMAKGNGKTPWAAGTGLKGLSADGQTRPEIYAAATTANQARILYRDVQAIVAATPELKDRLRSLQTAVTFRNGFIKPVSAEGRSLSGPRVHMALIDEIHEHPTDVVIEKLRAGTKRNLDALILEITNSGASRTTPCWEDHQYSINVLDGVFDDDAWFAYVCALDSCEEHSTPQDGCEECDDWRDEAVWPKVNPGLDTILPSVYLREQVVTAVNAPVKQNLIKRLNFCIWTEQVDRWIDMDIWRRGNAAIDRDALRGEPCYGGLDLASRRDFTAFVLYFPTVRQALAFFWVPEAMETRTGEERQMIERWEEQGFVRFTPGNITDYDVVREDILELAEEFEIRDIGYDQWNATQIATQLGNAGATMVPLQQGGAFMSEAAKDLEAQVGAFQLNHGGNPVLDWMASNVAVEVDRRKNVKLDREHSGDRIDGMVALVMAKARAMVADEDTEPNFYG